MAGPHQAHQIQSISPGMGLTCVSRQKTEGQFSIIQMDNWSLSDEILIYKMCAFACASSNFSLMMMVVL